jgi:hypothetical protein
MDERLQEALDEIIALVEQGRQLSARDQDALATRLETMASTLRWEMLFHLPAANTAKTLDTAAASRTPVSDLAV